MAEIDVTAASSTSWLCIWWSGHAIATLTSISRVGLRTST